MSVRLYAARAAATGGMLVLAATAAAQTTSDFSGKTVTIIASFEAGGPYDFYARLVARHIGAHLPGKPNVIVQNMPGAGGLRGANYLYNVAAKDGTVMGVVSQTVAVGQVLGTTPGIQYDARQYTWIGRMNANVEVDHAWHASGVRSIKDVMARETIAAGTGPTSSSVVMRRLMNELVGTKYKVVTGFQGPTSAQLAFERGEVDAIVKPWSSIKSGTPEWLRDKKIFLLVQFTRERHRELQDVPAIVDLARDDEQRADPGAVRGRRAARHRAAGAAGRAGDDGDGAAPRLRRRHARSGAARRRSRRRGSTSSRCRARICRRWSPARSRSRPRCWRGRRALSRQVSKP